MTELDVTLGLYGSSSQRSTTGSGEPAADDEFAPGVILGEYVIRELIACGGHGSVYLAEHRVLHRRAAIKVLHRRFADSAEMVGRFVREAQVVNRIGHRNIVDIYDLGTLPDGRPFCVMEHLQGQSLRKLLRTRGRITVPEALTLLEQVCAALQAAHEAGVVHRDVKASNIMLLTDGARIVKLLDFGVAKVTNPGEVGLTTAGERLGTFQVMAPEQIVGGRVDARTDVYAVGVLLHQLVTGQLPFAGADPSELERQHLEDPPPRPSEHAPVPRALDGVVARAMAKRPEQRYPTVNAFFAALRYAASPHEAAAVEVSRAVVAIHAGVRIERLEDREVAALSVTLEAMEEFLRAAGFAVPLQTSSAVLGIRFLSADSGLALAERAEALTLARRLLETSRRGGELAAAVEVSVHSGMVLLRGDEIVGGPIFRTEKWVKPGQTFHATPEALEGLAVPSQPAGA